jgi:hypothetical protein
VSSGGLFREANGVRPGLSAAMHRARHDRYDRIGPDREGDLTMRGAMILAIMFMTCPRALFTQQGTAENGYYPPNYRGRTFTGTVALTNDATREVTLTFTDPKKGKTETLVCSLEEGYALKLKDGTLHELKPSDFRLGTVIKIYYTVEAKKVEGKKTQVTTIIMISRAPNARAQYGVFKVFN